MNRESVFCTHCGANIGHVAFCTECGTKHSVTRITTQNEYSTTTQITKTFGNTDKLVSSNSSAADLAHYNRLQGTAENTRAAGGPVKTWRPATEQKCAEQSDKMADKVMDLLAGLPQIGSQKSHVVPNWQKGRVGTSTTTTTTTVITEQVSGATGNSLGRAALDNMPPKQGWKMN